MAETGRSTSRAAVDHEQRMIARTMDDAKQEEMTSATMPAQQRIAQMIDRAQQKQRNTGTSPSVDASESARDESRANVAATEQGEGAPRRREAEHESPLRS